MNKLLIWAILMLSIMGGFAARAEAAYNTYLWYDTTSNFVWCGKDTDKFIEDIKIHSRGFGSDESCKASNEYKDLSTRYDNNSTIPSVADANTPIPNKLTKLQKYIKIFEKEVGVSIGITGITFGKLKKGTIGFCYTKNAQVVIDETYWNGNASELDKEMTVYHELAHCVLDRDHIDNVDFKFKGETKGCPVSLMHSKSQSNATSYRCFHLHRAYYWNELRIGTYALRIFKLNKKTKKDELIKSHYIPLGFLNNIKIGAFSCRTWANSNKPKKKDKKYIKNDILYTSLSLDCTRDKVIIYDLFAKGAQPVGSWNWYQGMARGINNTLPTLYLYDKILDERYKVYFHKIGK